MPRSSHPHPLLGLWFQALHTPPGICVASPDPDDLIRRLNNAKDATATDEEKWLLRPVSLRTSPRGGELWMVVGPREEEG